MVLPENISRALDMLESAGHEAWVVGGCVRDSLMGIIPHDYDITTSALPAETEQVFAGYRLIETGLKHGTVTVLADGSPIEITTAWTANTATAAARSASHSPGISATTFPAGTSR